MNVVRHKKWGNINPVTQPHIAGLSASLRFHKLTLSEMFKKFLAFCGIRMFIEVFTTARRLYLS